MNENASLAGVSSVDIPGSYTTQPRQQYSGGTFTGLFDVTKMPNSKEIAWVADWRMTRLSRIARNGMNPPIR